VSFSRAELKSFTGSTLPDLIAEGVRLLFVGINPGLRSVAVQGHFAPRGNRFYPALAGMTIRSAPRGAQTIRPAPRVASGATTEAGQGGSA
jgi:G:T/U-mismatch repair DNA glycosylase